MATKMWGNTWFWSGSGNRSVDGSIDTHYRDTRYASESCRLSAKFQRFTGRSAGPYALYHLHVFQAESSSRSEVRLHWQCSVSHHAWLNCNLEFCEGRSYLTVVVRKARTAEWKLFYGATKCSMWAFMSLGNASMRPQWKHSQSLFISFGLSLLGSLVDIQVWIDDIEYVCMLPIGVYMRGSVLSKRTHITPPKPITTTHSTVRY